MTPRITRLGSSWLLPTVLSTTAGAVDVVGFLALGGLFTAHITGNVVIVAAHYVTGGFSQIGPLLAVPVFMAVMGLVTLASSGIARAGTMPLRPLLLLQTALLAGFLLLGVWFGRFPDADSSAAVPTAVMTTNITQLTLDLSMLARSQGNADELAKARRRARMTFACVIGFAAGCAAGAALEIAVGLWALALPVILSALAIPLGRVEE